MLDSLSPIRNQDVNYVRKTSVGRKKAASESNPSVIGSKAHSNSVVPSRFSNKVSLKDLLARARED
jgi:hypothetical protein